MAIQRMAMAGEAASPWSPVVVDHPTPAPAPPRDTSPPAPRQSADRWRGSSRVKAARVGGHVLIWALVLVPTCIQATRGWLPLGDDAEATARSLEVVSRHPPLVGMVSAAFPGAAHQADNLGPLLFWLLALPVHLDVARGDLWGGAVIDGLVFSIAFESALRARLVVGALLALVFAVDLAWRIPSIFFDPAWNAYVAVVFLAASFVVAYVVANGHVRWWPVLVFTGSVAAQAHLFLVAPAVLLMVGAPIYGLVTAGIRAAAGAEVQEAPKRTFGWVLGGMIIATFCWAPTIVQECIGHPGNLSVILQNQSAQRSRGIGFGLRSLATAVSPIPLWLRSPPGLPPLPLRSSGPAHPAAMIEAHSAIVGLLAVLVLVAITASLARREPRLASLSVMGLLMAIGVVVSFGSYPTDAVAVVRLDYLSPVLWVMSIVWWFVAGWTLVWVIRVLMGRDRHPAVDRRDPGARRPSSLRFLPFGLCLVLVVPIAAACNAVSHPTAEPTVLVDQDAQAGAYAAKLAYRGPVELFSPPAVERNVNIVAIALYLRSLGRTVDLSPRDGGETDGLNLPSGVHWPQIVVDPNPPTVWNCVGYSEHCASQLKFSFVRSTPVHEQAASG